MPSIPDWKHLHDATILGTSLEWQTGEVRVRVRLSAAEPRAADVVVSECSLLMCPRHHPWGPSISINEVRQSTRTGGNIRLEIEVQSGDVIEIEGRAVVLEGKS